MPLLRSIAKSLTWRVIGLVLLGGLVWILTSDATEALLITLVFNGIRVGLYVLHEELWERWRPLSTFGRSARHTDSEPYGASGTLGEERPGSPRRTETGGPDGGTIG